jgi:hypothetical protein
VPRSACCAAVFGSVNAFSMKSLVASSTVIVPARVNSRSARDIT